MSNSEIASLFTELANIMEIAGENIFKIRSYRTAAVNIKSYPTQLTEMKDIEIEVIRGVGKAIREKIGSAIETKSIPTLEKWRKTGYATLLPILGIKGVSARKLSILIKELQVNNLDELRASIAEKGYIKVDRIDRKIIQSIEDHISR